MARDWLIAARGERKQNEVAVLAGISQQMYSTVETGAATPSVKAAKRLVRALSLPDWMRFFEDTVKMTNCA